MLLIVMKVTLPTYKILRTGIYIGETESVKKRTYMSTP